MKYVVRTVFSRVLISATCLQIAACDVLDKLQWEISTFSPPWNMVRIDWLQPDEAIICSGYKKGVYLDDRIIDIQIKLGNLEPKSRSVPVLKIEARDTEDTYKLVGSHLEENDTFSYKDITWKILDTGENGISVGNDTYCRTGFILIKRVSPPVEP